MGENKIKQLLTSVQKPGSLMLLAVLLFGSIFPQSFALPVKTAEAATGVPLLINFQGRLTNVSGGTNVANGTYTMRFKIYDALTSGTLLWTETRDQAPVHACQKVQVTAGVFNVKLGSCNSLSTVDFTSDSLYLSVDFDGGSGYDGEMSPRKQLVSAPYAINANNVAGSGKIDLTNTATTTVPFKLTANTLTTASGLTLNTTNNSAANTAWTGATLTFNNNQATTAVSSGSIAGLDIQFNQNTAIAGNNETAARINLKQNDSSSTDATVASLLDLANNDTATGNQITVTDGLKITGSNITNGINLSGTFASNLITSTNFTVAQSGQITSGNLAGGGTQCLQTSNTGVISGTGGTCGGTTTLQQAYGYDVDGSDATISLTTADDSIVVTNPSSSGTDSTFTFKIDQAASGAVDALSILNAGTGTLILADNSNASGNGVSIDVQSSSASQYGLKVTVNNGATNALWVGGDGRVGIGTTVPGTALDVIGAGTFQRNNIGTTATDGLILSNSTAAGAGAQQYSPRLRLTGQGWKTDATAASQTVDWIIDNRPVQGTANPSSNLTFANSINGGGYSNIVVFQSNGEVVLNGGTAAIPLIRMGTAGALMYSDTSAGATLNFRTGSANTFSFQGNNGGSFPTSGATITLQGGVIIRSPAAATLTLGAADAAAPVAQTISVQNVVTGTSNTAGADFTISGSQSTGTGVGGSIVFKTSPAGSTGSSVNPLVTAMTILGSGFVGIGSTSPGANLDLDKTDASSITAEQILFRSNNTAQTLTDGTTITNWRNNQFLAPTLNGVAGGGTETVTNAATLYVDAAPSGSNITITNPYALWVDAGTTRLDGTLNLSSITGSTQCLNVDTNGNVSGTGSACGGSTTLQQAYGFDVDGSDATISLTTADDSVVFSNPASSGTDSAFVLQSANLATGVTTNNFKNFFTSSTGSFDATSGALTNYGGYFSNTSTRSAGANAVTNVGLYATASGAQNNYAAIFDAGNVGIGTTTPTGTLEVKSTSSTSLVIGPNGATNPGLQIDSSVGSAATGIKITGNAAGSGVTFTAISSGSNENILFRPLGTGSLDIRPTTSGTSFRVLRVSDANPQATIDDTGKLVLAGDIDYHSRIQFRAAGGDGSFEVNSQGGASLIGKFSGTAAGLRFNGDVGIERVGTNAARITNASTGAGKLTVGDSTAGTTSRLTIASDLTASAWGLNGIAIQGTAATYTDSSTAISGTATNAVFNSFGIPTLAATNTSVTTTNAANVYIAGAPAAGTNQTITNAYALWVDAGTTRLDGTLNLSSITGSTQCLNVDTNGNVSGTGSACGGSTTLQQAYGFDVDGSDATISLTTADDSIVVTNPSSSGTDSTFTFKIDQAASGAVDALSILNAGTGTLILADNSNASGNGVSIDVQSSSASQYALRVTSNNSATNGLYVRADGRVGIGTTTPATTLDVNGRITALEGDFSNPAINIGNDEGIYASSGGNTVSIKAGNNESARFGQINSIAASGYIPGVLGVGTTSPDARLELAGDRTLAAWGFNGALLQGTAATYTDSSTAVSGTATNAVFNSFGAPTLAATNATVTTTNAATVYIAGAPTAGTNQTISNASALWTQNGNILLNTNSTFTPKTYTTGFDTSGQNVNAVFVSGKYAYVGQSVNGGTCSGATVTGCEVAIFDIHNPSNPVAVAGINTAKTVNTIVVSGKYAYVGTNSDAGTCSGTTLTGCEFSIYDISNPSSPTAIVGYSFNQHLNSIFVQGKFAYLGFETDNTTGAEFVVLDLSVINGTNVSAIGSVDTADATAGEGSVKSVYVQGRYAYLGLSSTTGTACTSGDATSCDFRIYDISNPFSPTYRGGTNPGIAVNSVTVSGKYAYAGFASVSGNDFQIYNIADPTAPTATAGIDLSTGVNSIHIQGKYAFIGKVSASGNDFQILDITDPTATPVDAGGVDVTFDVRSVFVSGKYAYIGNANTASSANEFRVLDIAGIDTPTITAGAAGIGQLSVTDNARIENELTVGTALNVGLGGINTAGPVTIESILTGQSSGAGVAGVYGNYTLTNSTNSVFQYGNRFVTNITAVEDSNVDSTYIGELIRIVDTDCDTGATALDCDNSVRGLEVQSWTGNNTAGTNTAIAGFGKTFGIQGTTDALAGGVSQPAAVFADLDNGSAATVGNAIRAYTNNATSADLVSFYQETTAYTGTGLLMNFGNNSGSYTGNFIDLQKAGSSKYKINFNNSSDITTETFGRTGSITDWASGTNGNTYIWKIPQKATTGTCATATAEGMIFQNTGGTQVGHICIDGPTSGTPNKLRFYAEQFNATSTDLAENYSDVTGLLTAGEVVAFDTTTDKAIVQANAENSEYLAGIISTAPGLLLTDASEDGTPSELVNPKPLAISGRVPVKVTDENGIIKKGDHLTVSLTKPGYAMKAKKAGITLGQAISDSKDGYVTAFVNLTTWNGKKSGLPKEKSLTGEVKIPTELLKELSEDNSDYLSEIFTDRVVARDVVSDTISTNTLSVASLKFIEKDGLSLDNAFVMKGGLKVDSISSITDLIKMNSDVEFIGTPFFNKDTAGFAKIIAGTKEIRIEFEKEYLVKPIVTANLSFERDENTREDDQIKNEELDVQAAFSGVQFVIINKNTKGFTILLNKKAPRDLSFSWIALAVKDATTFTSKDLTAEEKAQEQAQEQEQIKEQTPTEESIKTTEETKTDATQSTKENSDKNEKIKVETKEEAGTKEQ